MDVGRLGGVMVDVAVVAVATAAVTEVIAAAAAIVGNIIPAHQAYSAR